MAGTRPLPRPGGVTGRMKANGKTGTEVAEALEEAMSQRLRLASTEAIMPNTLVSALATV